MDAIQYITPDFTITVYPNGYVEAVINTVDEGMEYRPLDISKTSLGKLLLKEAASVLGQ
jgi:hypothetical protein